MRNTKKFLTITSLVSLSIVFLMLIAAIFKVKIFEGILLQVLLSMAIITFASAFSLSALGFINEKKTLSRVCIYSLLIVAFLGLIITWFKIDFKNWFVKITLILGILTIFFNIIAAQYIKLDKRYKVLQVTTYVFVAILDVLLTILICGVDIFKIPGMQQAFAVICVIDVALLCALSILARKTKAVETSSFGKDKDNIVKIKLSEYNSLIEKIEKLEKENQELKKSSNK